MTINWQATMGRVRAALMRRGRSTHDADDLVQEAWLRLACYGREQIVHQPDAFLMRTALNLSVDAYRAQVSRGEDVVLDEVVLIDTAPDLDAVVLGRERLARMSACLNRLTPKTREIFLAHRVEGLSYKEISHYYLLSISTVEKHIAKATLQLTCWMEGW